MQAAMSSQGRPGTQNGLFSLCFLKEFSLCRLIETLVPVKFSHAPDFMHESARAMLLPADSDGQCLLRGRSPGYMRK